MDPLWPRISQNALGPSLAVLWTAPIGWNVSFSSSRFRPSCSRKDTAFAERMRLGPSKGHSPQTETQHPIKGHILIRTIFQNKVFPCTAATGQNFPPIQGNFYTFALSSTGFWAPLNHKPDHKTCSPSHAEQWKKKTQGNGQ